MTAPVTMTTIEISCNNLNSINHHLRCHQWIVGLMMGLGGTVIAIESIENESVTAIEIVTGTVDEGIMMRDVNRIVGRVRLIPTLVINSQLIQGQHPAIRTMLGMHHRPNHPHTILIAAVTAHRIDGIEWHEYRCV